MEISYNITNREEKFFDVAKSVAKTSDFHKGKVGCCVVCKNVILSVASNTEKTHPLQRKYNKFRNFNIDESPARMHSEIRALIPLINKNIKWKNVEIYIYRILMNGNPAISKPCPTCIRFINDLGIRTVFYIDEHCNKVKVKLY